MELNESQVAGEALPQDSSSLSDISISPAFPRLVQGQAPSQMNLEPPASPGPSIVKGFKLSRIETIPDLEGFACFYTHQTHGTEVLFLKNRDPLKAICVSFATPPYDSSGVQHITEHDRFRGCKPYPSEDPVNDYERGSLLHESNAETAADYTTYYAASAHDQDFETLRSLILGSSFHALHRPPSFRQEGRRIEVDKEDTTGKKLRFNAVVLNEMWDYHCNPDEALMLALSKELLPGTIYLHNSAGNPLDILGLTHERMLEFVSSHYTPANARVVFSGDVDIEACLSELDETISELEPGRRIEIPRELTPITSPTIAEAVYPGAEDESRSQDSIVTINWVLGTTDNPLLNFKFYILEELLFDQHEGCLREIMEASGFGESIVDNVHNEDLMWGTYSIGFKGSASKDVNEIQSLVLKALTDIVTTGFSSRAITNVLAGLRQFTEEEVNEPARGFDSIMIALGAWYHGADPIQSINERTLLATIEDELRDDPQLFEKLVQKYLLDNTHRVTLVLRPDRKLLEQWEEAQEAVLQSYIAELGPDGIVEALKESERIPDEIAKLDTQRARDRIRRLNVTHMKHKTSAEDVTNLTEYPGVSCLPHRTNNVTYMSLALDLSPLPPELLPYAALFGDCLAISEDGATSNQELSIRPLIARTHLDAKPLAYIFIEASALKADVGERVSSLHQRLKGCPISRRVDVESIIAERRSELETELREDESDFAEARAEALLSPLGRSNDSLCYLGYLSFLRSIEREIRDGKWKAVKEKLEEVRELLFTCGNHRANIVCDEEDIRPGAESFAAMLRELGGTDFKRHPWAPELPLRAEGLVVPNLVNNFGMAIPIRDLSSQQHGSDSVIAWHLSNTRLWEQVRKLGGAYGTSARLANSEPILLLSTTSDPNIRGTVRIFKQLPEMILDLANDEAEIRQSIIRLIGEEDALQNPGDKGSDAFVRFLRGDSIETEQRIRDEMLATSVDDYNRFAREIRTGLSDSRLVLFSRRQKLESVQAELGLEIRLP